MLWKKKERKADTFRQEDMILEEDLDDEEFFMAEEIDGYASCAGMNAQRCSSDCFRAVMMPTITIIS